VAKPKPKKLLKREVVPYEPTGYEIKRIVQKVKSEDLFENLIFDPKYVPWFYIDNVIQRVFARMLGQGPTGPVVVKCTKEGSLSVVARGGAFDDYERLEYTFALSGIERTTTGTTANHLIDAGEDFVTQGIKAGDTVKNTTDTTYAFVTAVAVGDLTLSANIMAAAETYKIIPCYDFTFAQQVERIDLFTYDGKVNYQLSRDNVKPLGSMIELFEDSFYSLDFYTLLVRATVPDFTDATPQRVKLMGWFRAEG
jgi:hypothetical protein